MAILEKEIMVNLVGANIEHFEKLGYDIPRRKDKQGRISVKSGTKILVKVSDLPKSSNVKLTKVCDIHDCKSQKPNQSYINILKQRKITDGLDRCVKCGQMYARTMYKKNLPYESSLEYYVKTNNKEYLLNEFSTKNNNKPNNIPKSSNESYLWNCSRCGSEFPSTVNNRINEKGCPYCVGQKVNHTNCLWTTHPEIAKLLKYPQRGNEVTYGRRTVEIFICGECGNEQTKTLNNVTSQGFSCSKCADGLSYPEKVMYSVLTQMGVNFELQKTFKWSNRKVYDFYVKDMSLIIEVHGVQHYLHSFRGINARTLEEEQENDKLKERLARENGIKNYIVVDCRKSDLEYIKYSILDSELSCFIDVSNINWEECHEYACNSLVKKVSELWSHGIKDTQKICEEVNLARSTVIRYLKQCAEMGWCEYNPKEARKNIFVDNNMSRKIIQLSTEGDYIKEWSSITHASEICKITRANISAVCKRNRETAGDFKWMYKEDYDKYII